MRILFLFFLLTICFGLHAQDAPVRWATQETFFEDLIGKRLPNFVGKKTNGKPFNSEELTGEVVIINFWFEKCPPCIAEMPELNELVHRYKNKHVRFIGITHDLPMQAKRFQQNKEYLYEIVSLKPDVIRKLNINHGFPSNLVVGSDGRILFATSNVSFKDDSLKPKAIMFESAIKTALEALK
ncbi:TlpA family protein disulfide reductase [Pedobacter sandarakinus]|uniref:TlpA family protein disulfide reductase n=1 Tax=Pedobacter sandarakinus TaxID=353156 RepID=UPI00224796C7|nr:TlpA disulfide reductase family protein [Pedobacter sandarakinus]MCX2573864.1 TlpA disulfide reductase family protein [Pedobacter sandarakinus]